MYAPAAAAACVAALSLKRPVLFQMDRNSDFLALGGRWPGDAEWNVSFNDAGKISSLQQTVTVDCGFDKSGGMDTTSANVYDISWWSGKFSTEKAVTSRPLNTIMRAPGEFQGCLFMEAVVEQVAREMQVAPVKVQEANMTSGPKKVWEAMKAQADYDGKRAQADSFNAANRWRKRGVYMMGADYTLGKSEFYTGWYEKCSVRVEADGTVTIDHSGLELGQGLDTKACQAAAKELLSVAPDFNVKKVQTILPKSTSRFSWSWVTPTFGSGTSESVASAVSAACKTLASKMSKYKRDTWDEAVAAAVADGVQLSADGEHSHLDGNFGYHVYVAICVSVEIDVLTGETHVLSADIVQDAGKSLNPAVDIGQIEGCFIQALGFCLTEQQVHSNQDGRLINNGTWDYKIPSGQDIPIEMNVTLLPGSNDARGNVFGSKATGEPTYLAGGVTFFAVKDAIYAARSELGHSEYFRLNCPASPESIQEACLVSM